MTLTKNPIYNMEKIRKRINFEGSMGKKMNECSGHIAQKVKVLRETPARGYNLQNCMKETEFGVLNNFPRSHLSRAETLLSRCLSSGVGFCPLFSFPFNLVTTIMFHIYESDSFHWKMSSLHLPIYLSLTQK